LPAGRPAGEALRDAVRGNDVRGADGAFAAIAQGAPQVAFDALLCAVQDGAEVHRVALPHRAWDLLSVIGMEHAQTLLRQSVHYLVKNEGYSAQHYGNLRALLPQLLEQHRLLGAEPGARVPDDGWIDRTCQQILEASPEDAAGIAAQALQD